MIALLHRVFITPAFQLTAKILAATVLALCLSSIFGYAFICTPVRANWDPNVHGHCVNEHTLTEAVRIPWVVTDFAVLVAPIPMVWGLQLPRGEKIGLYALFFTGGL